MLKRIFLLFCFVIYFTLEIKSQTIQKKYWEYPREFDYPKNIPHGTYDFDEWPGIDHSVVYKNYFYFNQSKYDNLKIDYDQNTFNEHDHEGYLKEPEELEKGGIIDFDKFIKDRFKSKKKIKVLGIFAHPDDETILAGGLLIYFHENNSYTSVIIVSNGAASPKTVSEKEIRQKKLEYNAFGVLPNHKVTVKCDLLGVQRVMNLNEYGKKILHIDSIEVLKLNEMINSKRVTEFGEISDMDYLQTYGPNTKYRDLLFERINEKINLEKPDIIITHGANGEYGHYLHIVVNLLVVQSISLCTFKDEMLLFTCMPEYNYDDKISHFLDLQKQNVLINKWNAIKAIPEIYIKDKDFDKPWDPEKYPNGVFMKDYGYSPVTAEPPRYEYFSLKKF